MRIYSQGSDNEKFDSFPSNLPISKLLLDNHLPVDTQNLEVDQLQELADEVREFLLYSVANSGGHFGAGLGAIELTIALHYVLNLPDEKIIWDTGHQAYPHKILTGRKQQMNKIRSSMDLPLSLQLLNHHTMQ